MKKVNPTLKIAVHVNGREFRNTSKLKESIERKWRQFMSEKIKNLG